MNTAIPLANIVEMLLTPVSWTTFYYDKKTGDIFPVTVEEFSRAERPFLVELQPDGKPDAKQIARAVLNGDERYVQMPSLSDIDEYAIMERYSFSIEDDRISRLLTEALQGAGAIRQFEKAINRLGVIEEWHGFLELELRSIAKQWCEDNGIDYTDGR